MSNRTDLFNSYSPSNFHGPFVQNYVYENSKVNSNKKSMDVNQRSNDINQDLARALGRVEILKAEKIQLKEALRTVLERRSSENILNLNVKNYLNTSEFISPRNNSYGIEEKLQKENAAFRDELQKCYDELSNLKKENGNYRTKLDELERINLHNLQLKEEMEKINGRLTGIASGVKPFEENNIHHLNGGSLSPKTMKYINYTLQLIEKHDPSHFLKNRFFARFESSGKIQELIEGKQFQTLIARAFKYISDLIPNVDGLDPLSKKEFPFNENKALLKKSGTVISETSSPKEPRFRSQSPVTSDFEENVLKNNKKQHNKSDGSRNNSPGINNIDSATQDANKNGSDSSRALKKIITNISAFPSKSRDNARQSSPTQSLERTNAEPRFVLDTPRETRHVDGKPKSTKKGTSKNETQKISSPTSQERVKASETKYPYSRSRSPPLKGNNQLNSESSSSQNLLQMQGVQQPTSFDSRNPNKGIYSPKSNQILFDNPRENFQMGAQRISNFHNLGFDNQQKSLSSIAQGSNKPILFYSQPNSQIPFEYNSNLGSGYFQPQIQQNIWTKGANIQGPQFNRRQSEQVSTGIPVTTSNSFRSNHSPRNYDSMFLQGQNTPQNKFHYAYPQQIPYNHLDLNESAFPYPHEQHLPQPHAYQPSPSHQRYYQILPNAPDLNHPNYLHLNYNRGGYASDQSQAQNILETQDLYNNRIPSNESHSSMNLDPQGYLKGPYQNEAAARFNEGRNNILSYRSSEPSIGSIPNTHDFINLSPTYHSSQRKFPSPNNLGQAQAENTEILSPNFYSTTPYFISMKPRQNFEVIPEESDRHNNSEIKLKQDKKIQVKTPRSTNYNPTNTDDQNVVNSKATQTSSCSVTPSSKLTTRREAIPALNLESIQKQNIGQTIEPQANYSKNSNPREKEVDKSHSRTPTNNLSKFANEASQGATPNDSSADNSQIIRRNNNNRKTTNNLEHGQTSMAVGRATLGVMGNQEMQQNSNKKALNASEEMLASSLNTSNQKTFRVSFGKTLSLTGADRSRFEIVPNDSICIVEVPKKKHITQQRKFDIISNEPKTIPITPESTNKIENANSRKSANQILTIQLAATPKPES